jgi:dipeptidyl-peptidase III
VEFLNKVSQVSPVAAKLHEQISERILAPWPRALGFPSDVAQSSYYPGNLRLSREELTAISEIMEKKSILSENTRVRKHIVDDKAIFEILQASTVIDEKPQIIGDSGLGQVQLTRGDHTIELSCISCCIDEARKYAANALQDSFLSNCQASFTSGDLEVYKESQRLWVKDRQPSVEVILGFVEPYRDPMGIRAEFEGLVAVTDKDETQALTNLVDNSDTFIKRLPWALNLEENNGKGPFEKELFEKPDFTSLYSKY